MFFHLFRFWLSYEKEREIKIKNDSRGKKDRLTEKIVFLLLIILAYFINEFYKQETEMSKK